MEKQYRRNEPRKYSKTWKSRAKSKQYRKWCKVKLNRNCKESECVGEVDNVICNVKSSVNKCSV